MTNEDDYKMWLEKMLIESNPDWVCDGMYDKEITRNWCVDYCGEDDEYITPKCLHMYYHHIERADRKTENNSEKPNNCEHITEDGVTCAKYPACDDCLDNPLNKVKGSEQTDCQTCKWGEWYRQGYDITMMDDECGGCCSWNSKWTPKTEPTISKMEQVDMDINVRSKDEPQTERKNLCGKQICDHLFDDDCALKTDCAWK